MSSVRGAPQAAAVAHPAVVGKILAVTSPAAATGLDGLVRLLPEGKGAMAQRIVAQGRTPALQDFHKVGRTLSPEEAQTLADWLQDGMCTRVVEEVRSKDGTFRLGVGLADGRRIETVAMPSGTVCVSTQVGCAVGCRFCASGLFGVERNLDANEIFEQVVHARRRLPTDRVVYMGMGEPSHNLDAVLEAVARIRDVGQISGKKQVVSTVGSVKAIARMQAASVRPCLAVSLHVADDARRRELLPRAHKDALVDIVAAADAYGRDMSMPVQFEWTLLEGVNDSDLDVEQVAELLKGTRALLNFIVWNAVPGMPYRAPSRERIVEIVRAVKARGVLATIRDSSGPDAGAACGQLRLKDKGGIAG